MWICEHIISRQPNIEVIKNRILCSSKHRIDDDDDDGEDGKEDDGEQDKVNYNNSSFFSIRQLNEETIQINEMFIL